MAVSSSTCGIESTKSKGRKEKSREDLSKAVYATAIAKYVIKKGRITVPAEEVLIDAEMVPVKPEGWEYKEHFFVFFFGGGGHEYTLHTPESNITKGWMGTDEPEW